MNVIYATDAAIEEAIDTAADLGFPMAVAEIGVRRSAVASDKPYAAKAVDLMLSRDGKQFGVIVNKQCRPCRMEGCTGMCQHVRWSDGKSTFPCSKGCDTVRKHVEKIM